MINKKEWRPVPPTKQQSGTIPSPGFQTKHNVYLLPSYFTLLDTLKGPPSKSSRHQTQVHQEGSLACYSGWGLGTKRRH